MGCLYLGNNGNCLINKCDQRPWNNTQSTLKTHIVQVALFGGRGVELGKLTPFKFDELDATNASEGLGL